jgi:signal transduction histidine kinase
MVLYRMLQESMNNAIRYSKAQNIDVVLKYDATLFTLTIADDGIGFDTTALEQSQPGMGFKSMKSRAALIGGKLYITSFPEKGTRVCITLQTGN